MKPRYRFKGRYPNGERKLIIEYDSPNISGKVKTLTLPKAGTLKKVLEKLKNPKGLEDFKKPCTKGPQSEQ